MTKVLIGMVSIFVSPAFAQQPTPGSQQVTANATAVRRDTVHRVDPGQMYHRVYARMPVVGSGQVGDPIRPQLAPAAPNIPGPHSPQNGTATPPPAPAANPHSGILGYTMILSDDGKWALCEFVAATPLDLVSITGAASSNVVVFERGKSTVAEIEADFQQYKKSFTFASFEQFTTRVQ